MPQHKLNALILFTTLLSLKLSQFSYKFILTSKMSADRIPNYMFINEETEELFDRRIKQRTQYDTSTVVPIKVTKKSINNTINLEDDLNQTSSINQVCYSSKFGLLIVTTKEGILIIQMKQYEELVVKSSQNYAKKYRLKDIATQIIDSHGKNSKHYLSPNQSRLLILNEQKIRTYDLETLSIQIDNANSNSITNIQFTQQSGFSFMGWSFYNKIYVYKRLGKQAVFEQIQQVQKCTCANYINQHLVICQKFSEDQNTKVKVFSKDGKNLIKEHIITEIGNDDNYLLQYCFPISIFKINVNIQDPVTKNVVQNKSQDFTNEDVYGIILAYYDKHEEQPNHRFLNFIKGNLIQESDALKMRGHQLFLSPSDQLENYFNENQKIPFSIQIVSLGHFFAILIQKMESVFVVDSLLPFQSLNIYALNSNHQIKQSSNTYLKGLCVMRNILNFQRQKPKFGTDNKTCEMICGKFKGEFLSLYFSAKQTQITVQFPACLFVLTDNKLIRKYAVSTVNGIQQENVDKLHEQIVKIGGKSRNLIIPQSHKLQSKQKPFNNSSNEISMKKVERPSNQQQSQDKKQQKNQAKQKQMQKPVQKAAQKTVQKPVQKPVQKKPVATGLFDNSSNKTSLFGQTSSSLFGSSKPSDSSSKSSTLFNLGNKQDSKLALSENANSLIQSQASKDTSTFTPSSQITSTNLFQKKDNMPSLFQNKQSNLPQKKSSSSNLFDNKPLQTSNINLGNSQSSQTSNIFSNKNNDTSKLFSKSQQKKQSSLFGNANQDQNKRKKSPSNNNNREIKSIPKTNSNIFDSNKQKNQLICKMPQSKTPNIFGNASSNIFDKNPTSSVANLFSNTATINQIKSQQPANKQNSQKDNQMPQPEQKKNIFGSNKFSSGNMFNLQKDFNTMTSIPEETDSGKSSTVLKNQQSSKKQIPKIPKTQSFSQVKKELPPLQVKKQAASLTKEQPVIKKQVKVENKEQIKNIQNPLKYKSQTLKKQDKQQVKHPQKKLQPLSSGVPLTQSQLNSLFFGANALETVRELSIDQKIQMFKQMAKMMNIKIQQNRLQRIQQAQPPEPQNVRYQRIKKHLTKKKVFNGVIQKIDYVIKYIENLNNIEMSDHFFTLKNAQKLQFLFVQNPQAEGFLLINSIRTYLQRANQLSRVYKSSLQNKQAKPGHKFGFNLSGFQSEKQSFSIKLNTFQNQAKRLVYSYQYLNPKNKQQSLGNYNRKRSNLIKQDEQTKEQCENRMQKLLNKKSDDLKYMESIANQSLHKINYFINKNKQIIEQKRQAEQQKKKNYSSMKYSNISNNSNQNQKRACFKFSMDDFSDSNSNNSSGKEEQVYAQQTEAQQKKQRILSSLYRNVQKAPTIIISLKSSVIFLSDIKTVNLVNLGDEDDEQMQNLTQRIGGSKQTMMRSSLKKKVDFLQKVPRKQEIMQNKLSRNQDIESQNFQSQRLSNNNSFSNSDQSDDQGIQVPSATNRQVSFSPMHFMNKKQTKKQSKQSICKPSLFGINQLDIKKTLQRDVIVQKNMPKDKKQPQKLGSINLNSTDDKNQNNKQTKPEGHKSVFGIFNTTNDKQSAGLFANKDNQFKLGLVGKDKAIGIINKQSTNAPNGLFGGTLAKKQEVNKPNQTQQNTLQKVKQISKTTTVQKQKPKQGSLFGSNFMSNASSNPGLFKQDKKDLPSESSEQLKPKQQSLFGGQTNKSGLFQTKQKQKPKTQKIQRTQKAQQKKQNKASFSSTLGSKQPKQQAIKQPKQPSLAFGSPQFSQFFNKQKKKQQQKKQNKQKTVQNIQKPKTDQSFQRSKNVSDATQQKVQNPSKTTENETNISVAISQDSGATQAFDKLNLNVNINNDQNAQNAPSNSTQNKPANTSWGTFNNQTNSQTTQNQTNNQTNHGIPAFGNQNKFMMGNAPLNTSTTGFNPNEVSFSGGFNASTNNFKSFASFNNSNTNSNPINNSNTSSNNQAPSDLFKNSSFGNNLNQPKMSNNGTNMNSSQNSLFGNTSGLFNNANNTNNNQTQNMGNNQFGFSQQQPSQQQNGGNFLSGFNANSQGANNPVAPAGNSHLFQPRK